MYFELLSLASIYTFHSEPNKNKKLIIDMTFILDTDIEAY